MRAESADINDLKSNSASSSGDMPSTAAAPLPRLPPLAALAAFAGITAAIVLFSFGLHAFTGLPVFGRWAAGAHGEEDLEGGLEAREWADDFTSVAASCVLQALAVLERDVLDGLGRIEMLWSVRRAGRRCAAR